MKLNNFNHSFNNFNAFDKARKSQMRLTNQNINFTGNITTAVNSVQDLFKKHTMFDEKVLKRILKIKDSQKLKEVIADITNLKNNSAQEITKSIDNAIGKADGYDFGFFTSLLKKANVPLDNKNIDLNLVEAIPVENLGDYTYKEGLLEVIKAPLDVINAITKKIAGQPVFTKRAIEKEKIKSLNQARDILEVFLAAKGKNEDFNEVVAQGISDLAKNYSTRDERTINRAITSLVSAVYSAFDFYNISMLQTDDTKEAKEAQNKRFKQEITRLLLSSGFTFIIMGALDKFTKTSTARNVAVIAGSQILSDIVSRLINKVHLKWLTPEEAREIALKEKQKEQNQNTQTTQINNTQTQQKTTNNTPFRKNMAKSNEILYQSFIGNSKYKNALCVMMESIANDENLNSNADNKKKKTNIIKAAIITSIILANIVFLSAHTKNLSSEKVSKIIKILEDFKTKLTKKEVDVNLNELAQKIQKLKDNAPNSEEIETLLDKYGDLVNDLIGKINNTSASKDKSCSVKNGIPTLTMLENRFFAGFYDGIAKLPKMFYEIVTTPAKLYSFLFNDHKDKTLSTKNLDALHSLNKIINENIKTSEDFNNTKALKNTIDSIKKNTRNLKTSNPDTGDLASLSRSIITLVSSYFFIGDYRNKVLIESEGKDVAGANAEAKTRGAHKLTNFIINGTLMNVGNSLLRKQLNSSLVWAAAIPFVTEITNETLIRKCICQPIKRMKSRQDIIDYETKRMERKGPIGAWTRFFKKITGKKSLTEKTNLNKQA